ncbi:hypothetical protein, partial [Candidatus Pyrohabitans sp.]
MGCYEGCEASLNNPKMPEQENINFRQKYFKVIFLCLLMFLAFNLTISEVNAVNSWWNGNWMCRYPINITNNNQTQVLEAGTTIFLPVNLTYLNTSCSSGVRSDAYDLRIVLANGTEIDRMNITPINWSNGITKFAFALQEN